MKKASKRLLIPDALSYLYSANIKDMPKIIDLTGQKFGSLTVISFLHQDKFRNAIWLCECNSCGAKNPYIGSSITKGRRTHCRGCNHFNHKHGDANKTKEYRSYRHMLNRCYNKNDIQYPNYGGRGIEVCERWRSSYENFLSDIGRAPTPKHSLDRINNDSNYGPSNCRWATPLEQMNNQRKTRFITYKGETLPFSDFCRKYGVPQDVMRGRIHKLGWSIELALQTPKIKKGHSLKWALTKSE